MKARGPSLVSMRNIHVSYESVQALRGVDFDLASGEIHGLLGEHRAGKSTLVKLLSGAVTKEQGTIWFRGQEVQSFTPKSAMQNRIAIVYQNMNVIPSISAIENIFTGQRLTSRMGFLDLRTMESRAVQLFGTLHVDIDPHARLEDLTEAEQLMVEIAKALSIEPKLLIFDEISSKLTPREMETIYRLLFEFKGAGRSVIYISHNMDEIFEFADRVTILKNGQRQGTEEIQDVDKLKLIKMTYSYVLSREELEQDNRELYLLKKYNENIIRNLPIGVIILDQRKRISTVNFSAVKILALRDEVLLDQPLETLLESCAMEKAAEIVDRISGRAECTWEELHCGENGLIRVRTFPFKDDDYKNLGTILVIEDISRDRYFQDYLLRSEKIASIAELATGVAHEISNPLSVVLNYVNLLKRRHRDDPDTERLVKIERELSRIGEIIGSLLSFSKVRKIPMEPLSITRIIDEVVLLVDHKIHEKSINLRLPPAGPRGGQEAILVFGEENSLKQVFVNLLINSIEAVLERGTIEIAVRRIERETASRSPSSTTAAGSLPSSRPDLRSLLQHEGGKEEHGLGLSICQHIVESHEGVILCESRGKTTMRVRLPISGSDGGRMAILITGGCGLIGSTLARMLCERGETVWVFDRMIVPQRFSGIEDRVRTIRGELGIASHVLEAVKTARPSVIFHLGAMLSIPANYDPPAAFAANVQGIFHVLEAARMFDIERVRFTSTTATYGLDMEGSSIGDHTLQRPVTLYGTTKVFGELLGRFYRTRYGIDFRAVRFPSVVGPGAVVPHVSVYNSWAVEKACRGEHYDIFVAPHIRCAVLYFKDAARSLLVLDSTPRDAVKAVCYTLAGVDPMPSAEELAAAIRRQFPAASLGFAPEQFAMDYHAKLQGLSFDETSARRELGWKIEYPLARMIEDFADEYAAHPERYPRASAV